MSPIAQQVGCDYQPFSQMALIKGVEAKLGELAEGHGGVCYGLSVAWLETVSKSGGSFLDQVADVQNSPLFYRAYMSYRHQENYGGIGTSGTWSGRENATGASRFFGTTAVTQNSGLTSSDKSKSFGLSLAEMQALCAWGSAAMGTRYFMVSIPNHAMAMIGSRTGTVSYFDPNFGIVSSMVAKKVGNCLYQFFSNTTIKAAYHASSSPYWLTATKFK